MIKSNFTIFNNNQGEINSQLHPLSKTDLKCDFWQANDGTAYILLPNELKPFFRNILSYCKNIFNEFDLNGFIMKFSSHF